MSEPTSGPSDQGIDIDEAFGDDSIDEIMDTSYSPPERPLGVSKFGTTAEEQRRGESLEQRLAQEEPEVTADDLPSPTEEEFDDGREVGGDRAGRLVDPDRGVGEDTEKDLVGEDVGIDAGAASAEEAAVHVIDEDQL